jgi:hypothetical protein
MAYSALKKGMIPPKVVAAAMKSVGTCRMEIFSNIVIARIDCKYDVRRECRADDRRGRGTVRLYFISARSQVTNASCFRKGSS